ncbi:glutaminyl-peptide cyclotransferase [Corynebacterium renale]|uniref:Glutaminyl-peptide cyclotransferase n=1 Tax=Corynebacterium renale TaxID=1724 RepID=A0A2A9DKX4_9CORY|nr:glutaminyl-peptide cyclotransferase [Corynebacterium renale]PFG27021.1 glutaminyl-peptide cyclotransferase [Corynebacterium renale]SQI24432.1 glutamine cyclotransferase [Corynebacterium renale]
MTLTTTSRCGLALAATALLSSCSSPIDAPSGDTPPQRLKAEIVATYPFDATSFTQGLEFAGDGTLLVGTGQKGESRLYRRTLEGKELQSTNLPEAYFGEGITVVGDSIWQLTWQDGVALRFDAQTLEPVETVSFNGEGWGICATDDGHVLTSNGSAELKVADPHTLVPSSTVTVTREGVPVSGLNELECVPADRGPGGATVLANIFTTDEIVAIDATTGKVTATIDASGLPNNAEPDINNVLNGIAAIPGTDRYLLAGKRWPDLYEVKFVPAD